MSWKIIVDSSSNLMDISNLAENTNFERIPLSLQVGDEVFVDNANLDINGMMKKMYEYSGTSRSACPSPDAYAKAYAGSENIFVITISAALSGSYNAAKVAKEMYLEENPTAKVYVIDSLLAGGGLDVIALKLNELIKQGLEFEEIVKEITEYQKNAKLTFILSKVDNLIKNGRVSKVMGTIVGLLNIRLVGAASPEGEFKLLQKSRGDKKAVTSCIDEIIKAGYKGGIMRIAHRNNLELAHKIKEGIQEKFTDAQIYVGALSGLCSFYAEDKGIMVGYDNM